MRSRTPLTLDYDHSKRGVVLCLGWSFIYLSSGETIDLPLGRGLFDYSPCWVWR